MKLYVSMSFALVFAWSCGTPGTAGPTGAAGAMGATGAPGSNGTNGANGSDGTNGMDGSDGTDGVNGSDGATGPTGSTGATGATGATDPAAYAYVYNLGAQVIAVEADVVFDTNGALDGFTHTPGSTIVTAANDGVYQVDWIVAGVEPSQFALFQNGIAVAGGTYGSGAGTQLNVGQTIVSLSAGDVLTLRNHSSSAAVTLQTLAGGTQVNVNASLRIVKL